MLHFYFNETATIYLTLSERVTLDVPQYLFTFRPRVPGPAVYIDILPTDSNDRAQQFDVDVNAVFAGRHPGQWDYTVQEFTEPAMEDIVGTRIDTVVATAGQMLETGIMQLHGNAPSPFTQRITLTTFIQPK